MSEQNPYGRPFNSEPYPPSPPPQQPVMYPPPRPQPPLSPADERLWAMLSYLLAIIAGFLAPLIIYLVYRDRSAFVREVSRRALNLELTALVVSLALYVCWIPMFVFLVAASPVGFLMMVAWFIVIVGWSIVVIYWIVMGSVRANEGQVYEPPFVINFVKN